MSWLKLDFHRYFVFMIKQLILAYKYIVCMVVCMCVWMHVCARFHVDQRLTSVVFFLLHFNFEGRVSH